MANSGDPQIRLILVSAVCSDYLSKTWDFYSSFEIEGLQTCKQ